MCLLLPTLKQTPLCTTARRLPLLLQTSSRCRRRRPRHGNRPQRPLGSGGFPLPSVSHHLLKFQPERVVGVDAALQLDPEMADLAEQLGEIDARGLVRQAGCRAGIIRRLVSVTCMDIRER